MAQRSNRELAFAYTAAQIPAPVPDVVLTLGDYQWKVHSELLIAKSEFFKRALEGSFQEASSKTIVLHDDDPWAIARLIQFMYQDCYETLQDIRCIFDMRGFCLERAMQHTKHLDSYNRDQAKDASRSIKDIHAMMFNLADKYFVDGIVGHIIVDIEQTVGLEDMAATLLEIVDKVFEGVSHTQVLKYEKFKLGMSRALSYAPAMAKDTKIQDWCLKDPAFALQVINAYSRRVVRLQKKLDGSLEKLGEEYYSGLSDDE